MMQQASATDPAPGRRPEPVPEPDVEAARVAAVRRYGILGTPPDGALDRVTAMAARLFRRAGGDRHDRGAWRGPQRWVRNHSSPGPGAGAARWPGRGWIQPLPGAGRGGP
jgi:hypothetical protein